MKGDTEGYSDNYDNSVHTLTCSHSVFPALRSLRFPEVDTNLADFSARLRGRLCIKPLF